MGIVDMVDRMSPEGVTIVLIAFIVLVAFIGIILILSPLERWETWRELFDAGSGVLDMCREWLFRFYIRYLAPKRMLAKYIVHSDKHVRDIAEKRLRRR